MILAELVSCLVATDVIAVSPSVQRTLQKKLVFCLRGRKIRVLRSGSIAGVDHHRFRPSPPVQPAHLGNRRRRTALFVGRLSRDKGIDVLLDAWSRVSTLDTESRLLIAGGVDASDPIAGSLVSMIDRDESIEWLGHVQDVPALYRDADVLILPSRREGMPTVVLEAAAAGVPAIATSVTGCVDAVADGLTGILVPPDDSEALSESICTLLSNDALRKSLGSAARARVIAEFSPEPILEDYLTIYRACGRRRWSPRRCQPASQR